jgi:geranylgeranyl diphosphate synthase type II
MIENYLSKQTCVVNRALKKYLPKDRSKISEAMRYSVNAGGKRLRPFLLLEAGKICGARAESLLPAACSIEYIHTYSLIHDDLPAMDNDDLRRGRPTSHKKFGEATAILAGDALLTEAFSLLSVTRNPSDRVVRVIKIISDSAGFNGMIGGQMRDTLETANWSKRTKKKNISDLEYIHDNKTAALIKASLLAGAVLSGAADRQLRAFERYGKNIGLAFQIADDVLDITADKKLLGKKGSDVQNNKLTYPAVYGIEGSKRKAAKLVEDAKDALSLFADKARMLIELADYIIERKY